MGPFHFVCLMFAQLLWFLVISGYYSQARSNPQDSEYIIQNLKLVVLVATSIKFKNALLCASCNEQWIIYDCKILELIKLLWTHLHQIQENWPGRNFITTSHVNLLLIMHAGNMQRWICRKRTTISGFNFRMINSLMESWGYAWPGLTVKGDNCYYSCNCPEK